MSIRLRLTLWYSAVLLLGMTVFAAGMWWALHERLMAGMDARLAERVQGIKTLLGAEAAALERDQLREELAEFAHATPEGALIQVSDARGPLLPPGLFPLASAGAPNYSTGVSGGRAYRVLTAHIESAGTGYDVLSGGSLDEMSAVLRDFRNLLLWMVPAVVAMACAGGYWISRRALAPVDDITRVARSISVQNLSERLTVPRTGDEIQRMSETWNEVLERLDSAVNRIRHFTADASHELRTPLAVIRTTAELALRRERPVESYQAALREIQSEAERMTELTESLLTLARSDGAAGMTVMPIDRTGAAGRGPA